MRFHLVLLLTLVLTPLLPASGRAGGLPKDIARRILVREQSRITEDGVLAELTHHKKEAVRARAYRALGRIQDPASFDVVAAGLEDKKRRVRGEAAFALGQLGDEAAEPILIKALDDEKDLGVRARLVEALGKCGTETCVPLLGRLLETDKPVVAQQAAVSLGVLGRRGVSIEKAGPALTRALRGEDPELRWRAAFAAHRGKVQSALVGIRWALKAQDPLTLIHALRAASVYQTTGLLREALRLLHHPDWRVRVEALRALGKSKLPEASSQISLLLDDPEETVRLTAVEALGDLKIGAAMARLEELDTSDDWRLRSAYLVAFAKGSGDGAFPVLKEAMQDPDWRIRRAAAEACANVQTGQMLVLMETYLTDDSPEVLSALVQSLAFFPQKRAVELIRKTLHTTDPAVLVPAATAAGQRFDRGAVAPLLAAYKSLKSPVDTESMTAVLTALGSILTATEDDDPVGTVSDSTRAQAIALLEEARRDADANVAAAAAASLSRIRGEPVEPATQPSHELPPHFDLDLAVALQTGHKKLQARIETERGTILVRLLGTEAPGTVANFVTLARQGFYDGLTFHRVVPDFVIQGGDPRGDGWGGPGYAIPCEINPLHYETGTMGMALAGKDTGGSQFFITHSPQPHLDGDYTIFGQVIEGQDVVNHTLEGDTIRKITIERR